MLTRKQHELLLYLHGYLQQHGVSPSFDEMKDALALKSKSGIHRLISALEERGFIRRLAHRARAIEVVKLPEDLAGGKPSQPVASSGKVIAPDFGRRTAASPSGLIGGQGASQSKGPEAGTLEAVRLPLYGRIAAGTPIEALRDESATVEVPSALLSRGDHYCLEVEGDSMIEAGILDGDTVIIRRGEEAENGSIVVALVDGEEVTLKRIRRKNQAVALEPANKAYETRILPPDRVKVQGRLIGLLRRY